MVLVSEALFMALIEKRTEGASFRLTVEWGEPTTEEVTYYTPAVTAHDVTPVVVEAEAGE